MNKNCAIFIAGRDSYADTWDVFFKLFFKYWPDCPFPVYLISESKKFLDERIINLNIKENDFDVWDKQWASRIKQALAEINIPYFIFFHTDYLLEQKVNTEKILNFLKIADENNIGCIRLFPSPPSKEKWNGSKELGLILKTDDYSVSLQVSLWKRSVFENILESNWSPVDMEILGSKKSFIIQELFLGMFKSNPAISYKNGIKKGIWLFDSVKLLKKEGVSIKFTRPVESFLDYILRISFIGSVFPRIKRNFLKYYNYQSNIK